MQFSISCFMHASGRTLEVNVFVQALWLETKSGHIFGGGRTFEKLHYDGGGRTFEKLHYDIM